MQPTRLPEARRQQAIARLAADGLLVVQEGKVVATGKRWQAAMMRSITRLMLAREEWTDIRAPIALSLIAIYGDDVESATLLPMVEIMLFAETGVTFDHECQ
jgi:hypothetical protein